MAIATNSRRYTGRMPVAPARKMGTWKMAYADFLTALMAFFLIMWMISGTTPEERAELAQYFNDTPTIATAAATSPPANIVPGVVHALQAQPVLASARHNIEIAIDENVIRLDLHDTDGLPLFDLGSGTLNADGARLAAAAGEALAPFAHAISIEGHTDAFPGAGISNWELSSTRANDARRTLVDAGIDPARIQAITGLAATVPLKPGQPHLSANRRVSILIHMGG